MSHSGWSGTNRISALAGVIPSAVPLTLHIRYKAAAVNINSVPIVVGTGGSMASQYCRIIVTTSAIVNAAVPGGASASSAISANTWYSVCGVFASNSSRTVYVDGVASATNTTSVTPSAFDTGAIGTRGDTSFPATNCNLAEAAIWNVALTAEEAAALVEVSPLLIRPASLVAYVPLLSSGGIDFVAGPPTVGGTLTKDNDHPRVIYPRQRSLIIPKGATGGGGEEQAVGSSAGSATAAATGQSTARASSTVAGTSTVAATGQSTAASVGSAAGTSTAAATGTYTGEVQAVGAAAGTSTASAVGTSTGGETLALGPGWGERTYRLEWRDRKWVKRKEREDELSSLIKQVYAELAGEKPAQVIADEDAAPAEIAAAKAVQTLAPFKDGSGIDWEALAANASAIARVEDALEAYIKARDEEEEFLLMAAA